jgi:hypothetical protein
MTKAIGALWRFTGPFLGSPGPRIDVPAEPPLISTICQGLLCSVPLKINSVERYRSKLDISVFI